MKYLNLTFLTLGLLLFMAIPMDAQDWADLGRFKAANKQLGSPAADEHRIVFMGNSITEGWLQDGLDFFQRKAYVNRGISGQTTPQMLIRFRNDVIDLQPTVVVILAGINDIAGNTGPSTIEMITANLMSMAELAKAHDIKVVISSVLPAFDFPWRPGMEPADKLIDLNARLKIYTEKMDFVYLDYFSAMVDEQNGLQEKLTYDGVHPNAAGYKVMEPLAEAAIAKALNQK